MHPLFHPLFIDYITYFNGNHDYFECHEVLEEYWKDVAPGQKEHPLVGYVQIATGMYHWRRGNTSGAVRIFEKGKTLLESAAASPFLAYIDEPAFFKQLHVTAQQMKRGEPFTPFTLPLTNVALKQLAEQAINELPCVEVAYLRDKHKLRDRSDVLQARAEKIASKAR